MDKFDGTMELRPAPVPPSGTEVLGQLHGVAYGKATKSNQKRRRELDENSRSQPKYQQSKVDSETMHFGRSI
ncbi:hypothetical protein M5689_020673 [Euphorbia peplus]|nr:hypothetical protein M5689_020673 [Euphorbia peplus]